MQQEPMTELINQQHFKIVYRLPSTSELNNTETDNVKDLDGIMSMYNSIDYSDTCSKTSKILYQLFKDEPINLATDSESFKFKLKFLSNTNIFFKL